MITVLAIYLFLGYVHAIQCGATLESNACGSVSLGPGWRSDLGHAQVPFILFTVGLQKLWQSIWILSSMLIRPSVLCKVFRLFLHEDPVIIKSVFRPLEKDCTVELLHFHCEDPFHLNRKETKRNSSTSLFWPKAVFEIDALLSSSGSIVFGCRRHMVKKRWNIESFKTHTHETFSHRINASPREW